MTNINVVQIYGHIAPIGDLDDLGVGPSIQQVDLEVSKYDVYPGDHT